MKTRTLRPAAARSALLVLALSLAGAGELGGQLLLVTGVRNLGFGNVLPGVSNTVQPTDAVRSGQFDISGPTLARVEVTFLLPAVLSAPGGKTMSISFGPASAGYSATSSIGAQTAFDPRTPFRTTLSVVGRGWVFIGGALAAPGTQPAGSYSGSLTMTVALVGI